MRAIAATHQFGPNPTDFRALTARIIRLTKKEEVEPGYLVEIYGIFPNIHSRHTSLHRAKNAIRRHFRIASRKELLWTEEQV